MPESDARSVTCGIFRHSLGRLLEDPVQSAVDVIVAVVDVSTRSRHFRLARGQGTWLRGRSETVPVVWQRCNYNTAVHLDAPNDLSVADTDVPLSSVPAAPNDYLAMCEPPVFFFWGGVIVRACVRACVCVCVCVCVCCCSRFSVALRPRKPSGLLIRHGVCVCVCVCVCVVVVVVVAVVLVVLSCCCCCFLFFCFLFVVVVVLIVVVFSFCF